MANTARKHAAHSAHESNHLTYGHFGTSTYDEQQHEWTFFRKYIPSANRNLVEDDDSDRNYLSSGFKLIREPVRVLQEALPVPAGSQARGEVTANTLLKVSPQAATGLAEIKAATSVKELAQAAGRDEDSLLPGNQFAFGQATILGADGDERKPATVPIVAYVSRQDELQLRISLLGRRSIPLEIGGFPRQQVEFPSILTGHVGVWTSGHGLIRQIISSVNNVSNHPQTALAARTLLGTTIFDPVLQSTAATELSQELDPNAVLTITCKSTGGAPHADIAFQTQTTGQIAIVDVEGNWSIWRLKGRRTTTVKVVHRARLLVSGSLYNEHHKVDALQSMTYPDGWHKMCWLASSPNGFDRVLICNRYCAFIFDDRGISRGVVDGEIGMANSRDSILDVMSVASAAQECFILTTSRLLWMSTNPLGVHNMLKKDELSTLASWNHFRGHQDVDLCMHLLDCSDGAIVFLSTAASPMVTVYRVSRSLDQPAPRYSISDSMSFELPSDSSNSIGQCRLQAVVWLETSIPARTVQQPLFKLSISDLNGNVIEVIYQISDTILNTKESRPLRAVALPPTNLKLHQSGRYVDRDAVDDFVVGDERSGWRSNPDGFCQKDNQIVSTTADRGRASYDLRQTYLNVLQAMQVQTTRGQADLQKYLKDIEKSLVPAQPVQMLSDIPCERPYIAEIEEDSDRMAEWLTKFTADDTQATLPANTQQFEVTALDSRSLLSIYQDLVESWMSTLPSTIPDRTRIYQERMFRQVALDIYLSSLAIHEKAERILQDTQPLQTYAESSMLLPSSPPLIPIGGSPTLDSSQTLLSSQQTLESRTSVSVLAKYTTFKTPVPSSAVPRVISDILAHLPASISENPADYDYDEIELSTAMETASQSLDARARRRAEKAAKAKKLRLEKQQQMKKVAFEEALSVPTIASSSQIPIREIKSSQAAPPMSSQGGSYDIPGITLTQPERGVHGTRNIRNLKGKGKAKGTKMPGFN